MSLYRFIYYCAVIGGWAALAAWVLIEMLLLGRQGLGVVEKTALAAAVAGGAIGAGLNLVSGLANTAWQRLLRRFLAGLAGGAAGGIVGGGLGAILYADLGLPRALGWMIMGLAIGGAEGMYEGSRRRIRNGSIGGALGGLLGGLLFDVWAQPGAETFSRATGFVVLGVTVGSLFGLAQVMLKEAWLTVLDGFRPGRQLILSRNLTVLGRGVHLPLPLLGYSAQDIEVEHAFITRRADGSFVLSDNHSRLGTIANGQRIERPTVLKDKDTIKLGSNILRFNHRRRTAADRRQNRASPTNSAGTTPPELPSDAIYPLASSSALRNDVSPLPRVPGVPPLGARPVPTRSTIPLPPPPPPPVAIRPPPSVPSPPPPIANDPHLR